MIVVLLVNIWFWVLWGYLGLYYIKYSWIQKIALMLKKVACRRISDSDLIPSKTEHISAISESLKG